MRWSSLYWREFGCRWKGLLVMTVPWLLGNLHNVPHRVLLLNPALDFPVPLSSASLEETLRIPVLPHNHAHCFSPSPFSDVFLTSGKFLLSFVFFRTALSSSFSSFLNLLIQFFFWKISKVHETQNAVINNQKNCFLFSQGGRRELSIQHLRGSKGGKTELSYEVRRNSCHRRVKNKFKDGISVRVEGRERLHRNCSLSARPSVKCDI